MRHTTKTAFIIITLTILTGMATADFAGGSGTSSDPFEIAKCQQLESIQDNPSASYELVSDIDCTGTGNFVIGSDADFLDISFNGRGHRISNFTVDNDANDRYALFSSLGSGAQLKNFSANNFTIAPNSGKAEGIIAGKNNGEITNVDISGRVNGNEGGLTGGVVRVNEGTISNVSAQVVVNGAGFSSYIGGIAGENKGEISNVLVNGSVTADGGDGVGGIVGINDGGTITAAVNLAKVSQVQNTFDVGGITGYNSNGAKINLTINLADISTNSQTVGGVAGQNVRDDPGSDIYNSYSTGFISSSNDFVGGFVGFQASGSSVIDGYWDVESSTQSTSDGGTGLTTREMQGNNASNNMDFDFSKSGPWIEVKKQTFVRGPLRKEPYPFLKRLVNTDWYFPDGEGTSSDPYHIRTCQQLQNMNKDLDAHYELVENIDCSDTQNGNSGSGFEPIGSISTKFTGDLEGNGYVISNLESSNGGIFEVLGAESQISELGLSHFNVTAGRGLLSHRAYGSTQISRIYTSGNSTGSGRSAGIVSQLRESSSISKSYSTAKVSGSGGLPANGPGGIAKGYGGTVTNTYFRGNLTNQVYGSGNILGASASSGDIEDVYWDKIKTSNPRTLGTDTLNLYGANLSTQEMTGESAKSNMDLDFQNTWQTVSTQNSYSSDGYPILRDVNKTVQLQEQGIVQFAGGQGTEADPFEINSCQMLQNMEYNLTAHYELTQDIDCSNSDSYDGGTGFEPIGSQSTPFDGAFDGRGHIIRNIYVNASEDAGLFSHLGSSGIVKRTRQIDSFINGTTATYSGGFVGDNSDGISSGGTIQDVEFDGTVYGGTVGGIAGRSQGNISRAETSGNISSFSFGAAGGIVGTSFANELVVVEKATNSALITSSGVSGGIIGRGNDNVKLERTINYGSVQGSTAGGLWGSVGLNQFPDIRNSFSTGNVTGSTSGGLFGEDQFADVKNVYWDVQASTQVTATSSGNETGGQNSKLKGLTTSEMTGSSASTNIENLSFSNTFETVTRGNGIGENGYPIFQDLRQAPQLNGQGIGNFSGGDGSSGNSLEVNDCHQLQDLQYNLTLDYELVSDVDCSNTESWNNGKGFEPIGKSFGDPFSGTFVGNNFTIKDLYATSQNEAGVFAQLKDGGVVKEFKLSNATIIGEGVHVGGVVGDNQIGPFTPGGKIKNVIFEGSVNGTQTGGIAGRSNGEIIRVYVDGEIHGTSNTAGIVGSSFSGGDIKYAHNAANVTGPDVAGISGRWSTDAGINLPLEINNTINTGKLNGTNSAGGILGPFAGFQAPSNAYLGNSISAGNVTGPGTTRGIAPEFIEAGDTQNLYWDKKSTGQQYAGSTQDFNGATGLTTSEMQGATPKCQGTMSGLDFRNTWAANESAEYPQLKVFVDQEVSSVSNSNAPKGALWVQDNTLHWADGSDEYFLDFQGEAACDVNGDNGGFWVQGSTLRWIDQDGDERIYEGSKVQDSASGPQGATWFQNGFIHYIDGNGDERRTDGF